MTVVSRTRGHKTTHYVVVTWRGKRVWENVGTDKREAQRLDKRRRQEVKDGTYIPPRLRGMTVARYAEAWLSARRTRSVDDDRRYLEAHVLSRPWFAGLRMDEVRSAHLLRLVEELRTTKTKRRGAGDKPIAPKTIANIYGAVRTMFRDAAAREDIDRDPCALPKGAIRRGTRDKRTTYSVEDVRAILLCDKVPLPMRVFAALALLTGMREGEVCGRRWRDWDRDAQPLGCLTVDSQYAGAPLKTDRDGDEHPRLVPVHPALAAVLDAWWREGFELVYCRKPTPEDFIVPQRDGSAHTRSTAYKAWRRALALAGVANRSLHSTRHTFVTLCRRGGASKDVVERITHNAAGDIVDRYTHLDWEPLCAAVLCLPFGATVDAIVDARTLAPKNVVEAPGIEPGGSGVTERNDSEASITHEPPKLAGKSADLATGDADRCARQQLPPGYVGTRVEVDGRSARILVEPGDTARDVERRVAKAVRALAGKAAAS